MTSAADPRRSLTAFSGLPLRGDRLEQWLHSARFSFSAAD
jgi:hypothetical protein